MGKLSHEAESEIDIFIKHLKYMIDNAGTFLAEEEIRLRTSQLALLTTQPIGPIVGKKHKSSHF